MSSEEKNIGETGCILKIRIDAKAFEGFSNCLVFLGDTSPAWTKFIVDHRYECDDNGRDPCGNGKHPAIVIGQMADNKMDIVRERFDALASPVAKKYEWFYNQITRNKSETKLDALELGNQIAFCDEGMNELVKLVGYYIFDGKEWREHGIEDT